MDLGSITKTVGYTEQAVPNQDAQLLYKDIVFVFDVTSNNIANLWQVREFFAKGFFPRCRYGVILHSDYFNKEYTYRISKLSSNTGRLFSDLQPYQYETFLTRLNRNYEMVLNDIYHKFSWKYDNEKIVIFIGNGIPYDKCHTNINVPRVLSDIYKKGIKIHTIQTGSDYCVMPFYKELASMTGGCYSYMDYSIGIPWLCRKIIDPSSIIELNLPLLGENVRCLEHNYPYQGKIINKSWNILQVLRENKVKALKKNANISGKIYVKSTNIKGKPKSILVGEDFSIICGKLQMLDKAYDPDYSSYIEVNNDQVLKGGYVVYEI